MVKLPDPTEKDSKLPIPEEYPDLVDRIVNDVKTIDNEKANLTKRENALKSLSADVHKIFGELQKDKYKGVETSEILNQLNLGRQIVDNVIRSDSRKKKRFGIKLARNILVATAFGKIIENLDDVVKWANET